MLTAPTASSATSATCAPIFPTLDHEEKCGQLCLIATRSVMSERRRVRAEDTLSEVASANMRVKHAECVSLRVTLPSGSEQSSCCTTTGTGGEDCFRRCCQYLRSG